MLVVRVEEMVTNADASSPYSQSLGRAAALQPLIHGNGKHVRATNRAGIRRGPLMNVEGSR